LASDPGNPRKGKTNSVGLASKMAGSSDSQCKIRVKCAKRAARAEIARKKKEGCGAMGGARCL